jgi:hypothetical protein
MISYPLRNGGSLELFGAESTTHCSPTRGGNLLAISDGRRRLADGGGVDLTIGFFLFVHDMSE